MEIKVLGPRCSRCGEVEKRVVNALAELHIAAQVETITDIEKMMSYGILATPGVVINGQVKSSGRIPRIEDIKAWIREAAS